MSAKFTTLREHFSTFFGDKMIEILTLRGDFGAPNYYLAREFFIAEP